jgi:SAM-dependent methyltransferase
METPNWDPRSAEHWDGLLRQPRMRSRYPQDHVVRFLMNHFRDVDTSALRALDIGVGSGRHTKLLCDLGFQTSGIDISAEGLGHCTEWLEYAKQTATLKQTDMGALPFPENHFDVAISYGVYNYADAVGMLRAVGELHRVLRPGGLAFVMLRTTDDYRVGKGPQLEPNTYRIEVSDTNELGTVQHFLSEGDVPRVFATFSELHFEKSETTFNDRRRLDSDWLITVKK